MKKKNGPIGAGENQKENLVKLPSSLQKSKTRNFLRLAGGGQESVEKGLKRKKKKGITKKKKREREVTCI